MRFCGQGNASNLTVELTLRRESTGVGEIPPTAVGGSFSPTYIAWLSEPNPPDGSRGIFQVQPASRDSEPNPPDGSRGIFKSSLPAAPRSHAESLRRQSGDHSSPTYTARHSEPNPSDGSRGFQVQPIKRDDTVHANPSDGSRGIFKSKLQTAEAGLEQSTHFRGWDFRVLESRFFVGWTLTIHQLPLVGFLAFLQSKS